MNESQVGQDVLRAPFPWFGGKRLVAEQVWRRLGEVDTFNEPFAGSLACLLARPHEPRTETVNDLDCYLANFWRALQNDPDGVAFYADSPVNEADLHARHRWLVGLSEFRERMMTEPDFFDVKVAGWWVWGQCLWIGSGWCNVGVKWRQPPDLTNPKNLGVASRRWQGGGQAGGSGVHAPRLSRKMPSIGVPEGRPCGGGKGIFTQEIRSEGLYDYLTALAVRLRRVRVCCGDWKRVLTPSVTTYIGTTGVFLDPPYAHDLRERCYAEDHDISSDVREWAIEHGDDPNMRIALCGYDGEHDMPSSWECVAWKAHGGYSRTPRGIANRERERIWFSPHCLPDELPLFGEIA